jgi:hypothetical protein
MDLSTFIVAVFCLIDDWLKDLGRLRARGPAPTLCDSEVLTIEIVGEFLGLDEDTELFAYFRPAPLRPLLPEPQAGASHHLRQAGGQPLEGQRAPLAGALGRDPSRSHLRALGLSAFAGMPVRPSLPLPAF